MQQRIVYLFGAGATHAELQCIDPKLDDKRRGLLITDVSQRVMEQAKNKKRFFKGIETVTVDLPPSEKPNVEMLISLLESSRVARWLDRTETLKKLVRADIEAILTPTRSKKFYLHRALLAFHSVPAVQAVEDLQGLITLNYDDVLDQAYRDVRRSEPNYCFSPAQNADNLPLLKLHGSFGWKNVVVLNKKRRVEIIPPGSSKTYIHSPYGSIWNRALYLLGHCDILRVVGCSLSPNDSHLIDLLFKAQLDRPKPFKIQIIDEDTRTEHIKQRYSFFQIENLTEMGVALGGASFENPFQGWLNDWTKKHLTAAEIAQQKYIKKLST